MKKNKKKPGSLAGLIGVLLLIIVLAFAAGSFLKNSAKPKIIQEYSNGFVFTKVENFWYTTIKNPVINQEYVADFRYSPNEVRDIHVEGNPEAFFDYLNRNSLNAAYFTFDPTSNLTYMTLAAADLSKFMNVLNSVTLVAACTKNETKACSSRPIVTCENKKNMSMVIFVKYDKTPGITMDENCLTITGEGDGLVKAYTKLLFIWYGVLI